LEIIALFKVLAKMVNVLNLVLPSLYYIVNYEADPLAEQGLRPFNIDLFKRLELIKADFVLTVVHVPHSYMPVLYKIFCVVGSESTSNIPKHADLIG